MGSPLSQQDGRLLLSSHSFLVVALTAKRSDREIVAASRKVPRGCSFQWPCWSLQLLFDGDVNPGELEAGEVCLGVSLSV